ncbi:hypothetical protein DFP92_10855 [Yoonia sediminilitoris]|uniref:Uncharacterized protein n=1 Tax=Yoonia sediminilitoris TaxID=1286148 RepID=A0A2T6KDL0_9RHOB|nr:hypothetical protein C8N45_10854 [Yoonia sediminilitoris]RCW94469.1 hypothetical protein DFP92_10855 [Yoonia sediminilitoris]
MDSKENKVVDLTGKPRPQDSPPASHFWFAQVDLRLGQIESVVTRLEWQVWIIVCACGSLLVFEIVEILSRSSQ